MSVNAPFVQELEQEAQATRRVLERVPAGQLGWKPHEKSMSLGQLALHVASLPGNVSEILRETPYQVPEFNQAAAGDVAELLPTLDESVSKAKSALEGWDEAAMGAPWTLQDGDRELMSVPRGALVRSLMLNHWYHHRGQLGVYLRLLNVPVPAVYGPSADENPFA